MSSATASDSVAPWYTASTVVARPLFGSHVFRIDGYSRTRRFGAGTCLTSATFSVGGHRWCIKYYPDDVYPPIITHRDELCIRLHHKDANRVKAQCKISLLDQEGNPTRLTYAGSRTFSDKAGHFGFHLYVKWKEFEESVCLKDDVFRVRCDVTVIKDVVTQDIPPRVVVPPSDMHQHLGRLLSAGDGADVTFQVGSETFAAHKYMLAARSSVFMAELFGPMKEKTSSSVRIDDMEARVFRALLHFVYTDSPPEMDKDDTVTMSQHLLVAADRYNLERLKLMCEEKLCKHIDIHTISTTLALAEQHGCRGLKEECFNFLKSPGMMKAVVATDGFEHLKNSCPSILQELVTKLAL
ncbi:BTB/POZ and MATH domain-containing protein 2-like [Lolium rigidum]|uniref:BTB/POZ and MATH domain-containing protein 2-like n=1 Tax=Lolium rigidum TaxID=89674 RepID=UPI001F5CC2FE|nr:BTB/POZ and MATH domain-containing protein 2-like [Lolium rigidum]